MEYNHKSVLLDETINALNIKSSGIYLDGTLGGGGHSQEILKKLDPKKGKLIALDRDIEAINNSKKKLADFNNVTFIHSNFSNVKYELKKLGIKKIDGAILDLGVSSYQIDNEERGFSYKVDSKLDMRMNKDDTVSAINVINEYKEEDLYKIIKEYGEERYAYYIAKNIVEKRKTKPIETTKELSDIIIKSIPKKTLVNNPNPEKRTFQAIRIEVNNELNILEQSVNDIIELLNNNSRICIISFHSLEDRIIKNVFKTNMNPCICPKDFPVCTCGKKSRGVIITKKPITPSIEEQSENSRSKSAKLRIFERIENESC